MEASDGLAEPTEDGMDITNTTTVCGAVSGDAAAAEDAILPHLAEITDDTDHFRIFHNTNGKKRAKCLWCDKECSNVTKLLHHVNKVKGQGVATCTATIPTNHKRRYFELYERKMGKKSRKNGEFNYCFDVLHYLTSSINPRHCYYIIFYIVPMTDAQFAMQEEIAVTQDRVSAAISSTSTSRRETHFAGSRPNSAPTFTSENAATSVASAAPTYGRKKPPVITIDSSPASSLTTSTFGSSITSGNGGFAHFAPVATSSKKRMQTKIWQPPCDPEAAMKMDVAIADLVHSNLYKFKFAEDAKFQRILDIARRLPTSYKPPTSHHVGGVLLDKLYDVNWHQEATSLLTDAHTFGISLFGDGATIKTTPMINALGAGVHNSFAMLDVFDCTGHCAEGGKKDAVYIAGLFLDLIAKLEGMEDDHVSFFHCTLYLLSAN
jgi:hypothetical protein